MNHERGKISTFIADDMKQALEKSWLIIEVIRFSHFKSPRSRINAHSNFWSAVRAGVFEVET